jgi:Na+/melibiose symporter-like transporter
MRALTGAIITAGAMVGLGLTAVGFGIRFHGYGPDQINTDSHQLYGIATLVLILVALLLSVLIGLGTAFLGLAYHHERRQLEHRLGDRLHADRDITRTPM